MSDRSFADRNRASQQRLAALLARLEAPDHRRSVEGGWTVGALLAHLGFWDRIVVLRWDLARRTGARFPPDLPESMTDLVNGAMLETWAALAPDAVVGLVMATARAVDDAVAALPDASIDAALAEGRPRLLDRSLHRDEHLAAIEAVLDRGAGGTF